MAFRSLTDDSRSLALANRYEARLQRLYDRAYKTLRELQQARKSEPTPPRNIHIRWVDPNEEPDQPTPHSPSVSEGAGAEPNPPCEPESPAPETELRNEPTDATNKDTYSLRMDRPTDQKYSPAEQGTLPDGNL